MVPSGFDKTHLNNLPSSAFTHPFWESTAGRWGEREEIGIFLIKMQFYKYLFYLMLQELNIVFLLLDLRRAAY